MKKIALVSLLCVCLGPFVQADNWGHWRGPKGNGVALNATPPTVWSATKNVKWKVEIPGRSSASPVIWEEPMDATPSPAGNELFLRGEKHLFCIAKAQ